MAGRLSATLTVILVCAASLVSSCTTATNDRFRGVWVMPLEGQTFMVLTLTNDNDSYRGTLQQPDEWSFDGATFHGVGGGVLTRPVKASHSGNSLRLVVGDAGHPDTISGYELTPSADAHALMTSVDLPPGLAFEPWSFTRLSGVGTPAVATNWDKRRTYAPERPGVEPNTEMTAIYAEDQAGRQSTTIGREEVARLEPLDRAHRDRVRAMLRAGDLRAAEDFRKAAFIFHHGTRPDEFQLAHSLALVALTKGDSTAAWIAAASLDRYLWSIHQPQIYGTQRTFPPETQDPFDQGVVSDAVRRDLHVPPLADQAPPSSAPPPMK